VKIGNSAEYVARLGAIHSDRLTARRPPGHEALTVLTDRGNFKGEKILACEGVGKRTAPCSNNGVVREE
jgi:hypothetical protein